MESVFGELEDGGWLVGSGWMIRGILEEAAAMVAAGGGGDDGVAETIAV